MWSVLCLTAASTRAHNGGFFPPTTGWVPVLGNWSLPVLSPENGTWEHTAVQEPQVNSLPNQLPCPTTSDQWYSTRPGSNLSRTHQTTLYCTVVSTVLDWLLHCNCKLTTIC